ncbi:MAG: isoleucine--tRNA ligase, partial [Robiginitomaculum sp.]
WRDDKLTAQMLLLQNLRDAVNEKIEPMRAEKTIRSSLEASVKAPADSALVSALTALGITRKDVYAEPSNPSDTLADYLIVSDCDLSENLDAVAITALSADERYAKCERSWKYFKPEGEASITPRDAAAVAIWDKDNA